MAAPGSTVLRIARYPLVGSKLGPLGGPLGPRCDGMTEGGSRACSLPSCVCPPGRPLLGRRFPDPLLYTSVRPREPGRVDPRMATFTGTDLVSAAAFSMALFSVLLLLALLSRAREDVLMSPIGWRLVALALSLFALRGAMRFVEAGWTSTFQHIAGLLAAVLLPAGLYLILRGAQSKEVSADLSGD